jgi:hypothetical protein
MVAHLIYEACTLFLTGEAHKGVRFLMRWSPYPEAAIKASFPQNIEFARLKSLAKLAPYLTDAFELN